VYFPKIILGKMSKNRDLLKEAIADAKTIKEAAIVNAKKALEETFAPHLQSMLSAKINEMDEEELEESEKIEEAEDLEESEEIKEEEVEPVKEETEPVEEEFNLEALLAELEEVSEAEETEEVYEADEETEETEEDDEEVSDEDEEEFNIEDMTEADLTQFIEEIIGEMIASGELEGGEPVEMGAEETEEVYEAADLEEVKDLKEKLNSKEKELKEAYDAIRTIKGQMNEVNLLNAKLLYTNKIFKSKSLNESQKVKVLTAFDKAKSVKEAKLVYETINESFKTLTKSSIKEHLGSASKTTAVVKPKKEVITEVNSQVERWKKLAGLND
jgi:hypothetical protein